MNNTTPTAKLREIKITSDEGFLVLTAYYSGVDRDSACGISCGKNKALALRMKAACLAGKAIDLEVPIKTDVNGKTYAQAWWNVRGRSMNADLKRLGY